MLTTLYLYARKKNAIRYGLLLASFSAAPVLAQTTYYVASAGSDTNDGRSVTAPFQSLSRVNNVVLQPGDAVLFRRGDTFRGTLLIRQSGTAEKPIRFDAYGSGTKPVLAGSVPVRNWTQVGVNNWQASCPDCGSQVTGLYQGGVAQPLGRYPNPAAPNRGNLTVQAHVGATQLTSQQPLTTNWTGGEVVVRPTYWIIDRAAITNQTGNTLTLNNPSSYGLTDEWGFFIQNHPATLDQTGEWYYNPATRIFRLYDDRGNPNEQFITATAVDRVIDIANAAFISIRSLRIVQARATNLYALNVGNLVLDNDDFTDSGEDGLIMGGVGSNILIENSTITDNNNNGVQIAGYQNVTLRRSAIRRIGLLPGRGKSGDGQFTAFQSQSTQNTLVENNVIDSVGYVGVSIQNSTTIQQNLITNFCMIKSDGGGIYLFNATQLPTQHIRIQSNIIRNGVGTTGGLSDTKVGGAHGVFLDDCVQGVDLMDNTIADCKGWGILMHAVNTVNVLRNTSFNNSEGQLMLYNYDRQCLPRNNTLKHNILVAKTGTQSVASYISGINDLRSFGSMEHNYYARPFNDLSTIGTVYNYNVVDNLNLSQWQSQFGHDLTSWSSPLVYKEYVIKTQGSASRISSSNGNSGGWETWSSYGNGEISWNAGTQSTGGNLTMRFSSSSGKRDSYALTYKRIEPIAKSKSYLIQFEGTAPTDKKLIVFIRQRQAPYQDLTRRYEFMVGPIRKSYEFALTPSVTEADALLAFQLGEGGQPVSLTNIRLHEATTEPVNPDAFIRLVYNSTDKDSTIVLGEPYRDVKNHYYARQVALKPFTSVLLLRDSLPPVDVSLMLKAERYSLKVGEVMSVSLTLRNSLANASTLPGQVRWSYRLPTSLTLVTENGLSYQDSLLSGTVQRLLTDTLFVFRVKATAPGPYTMAAQVTASTYADPDSTPDSGMDDGEDDQASINLLVRELAPGETLEPNIVTATEPAVSQIGDSRVYPNPTSDEFTFVAEADIVTVRMVDLLGRERFSIGTVRRGQLIRFGQSLPDAYYLLYIHYKTGERRTVRLVKLS